MLANHFEEHYNEYRKMISNRLRKCNYYSNMSDDVLLDAEDIVQNAYTMSLRYPCKDIENFDKWFFSVLNNEFLKALGEMRKGNGVLFISREDDDRIDENDTLTNADIKDFINNVIRPSLTPLQNQILTMMLNEESQKSMGEELDLSKQSVNNIIHRIRTKFDKEWSNL